MRGAFSESVVGDAALAWTAARSYAAECGTKMAVSGRERLNPARSRRQEEKATQTVLEQAALLSEVWATA